MQRRTAYVASGTGEVSEDLEHAGWTGLVYLSAILIPRSVLHQKLFPICLLDITFLLYLLIYRKTPSDSMGAILIRA